jgi:hypothetical protein
MMMMMMVRRRRIKREGKEGGMSMMRRVEPS